MKPSSPATTRKFRSSRSGERRISAVSFDVRAGGAAHASRRRGDSRLRLPQLFGDRIRRRRVRQPGSTSPGVRASRVRWASDLEVQRRRVPRRQNEEDRPSIGHAVGGAEVDSLPREPRRPRRRAMRPSTRQCGNAMPPPNARAAVALAFAQTLGELVRASSRHRPRRGAPPSRAARRPASAAGDPERPGSDPRDPAASRRSRLLHAEASAFGHDQAEVSVAALVEHADLLGGRVAKHEELLPRALDVAGRPLRRSSA